MKSFKILAALVALFASPSVFSYGMGISGYPLMLNTSLVSMEFASAISTGGGVGLQGRLTRKIRPNLVIDGGLGVSGGERNSRIFVGSDLELFPEYGRQPRISVKGKLENAREFGQSRNRLSVAPSLRKGVLLRGEPAFFNASLPYGVDLNSDMGTYNIYLSLNLGISGNLPFNGYRHIIGSVETSFGIMDIPSALVANLSWSIH